MAKQVDTKREQSYRVKQRLNFVVLASTATITPVVIVLLIINLLGYPATVRTKQVVQEQQSNTEQHTKQTTAQTSKAAPSVAFGGPWSASEPSVNSITTEDLQVMIVTVPKLLGGITMAEAQTEVDNHRLQMLETFWSDEGETKKEAFRTTAWWLITAATENHPEAALAINDLIYSFDTTARGGKGLGRESISLTATAISAIGSFGDWQYAENLTAKQVADNLLVDAKTAIQLEILREQEASAKKQAELAAAEAEARALQEEQALLKKIAPADGNQPENNAAPALQPEPNNVPNPAEAAAPETVTLPEDAAQTQGQSTNTTNMNQSIVDALPWVQPSTLLPPMISDNNSTSFGLNWSAISIMWSLRTCWEALTNAESITTPTNLNWHVLHVSRHASYSILGFSEVEFVTIWFGETADTLIDVNFTDQFALKDTIAHGQDSNGHFWWAISTLQTGGIKKLKQGDVQTQIGIADLVRVIVQHVKNPD